MRQVRGRRQKKGALTSKLSLKTNGLSPAGNPGRESLWERRLCGSLSSKGRHKPPTSTKEGEAKSVRASGDVLRKCWSLGALSSRDDGEWHFKPWSQLAQSIEGQLRQMSIQIPGCFRHVTISPIGEFSFSLEPSTGCQSTGKPHQPQPRMLWLGVPKLMFPSSAPCSHSMGSRLAKGVEGRILRVRLILRSHASKLP